MNRNFYPVASFCFLAWSFAAHCMADRAHNRFSNGYTALSVQERNGMGEMGLLGLFPMDTPTLHELSELRDGLLEILTLRIKREARYLRLFELARRFYCGREIDGVDAREIFRQPYSRADYQEAFYLPYPERLGHYKRSVGRFLSFERELKDKVYLACVALFQE